MIRADEQHASKVPEVTLAFWTIKIAATTLGETGGDTVTMTLGWGYLTGTAIFLALLVVLIAAQIAADRFHPFLYWATIVASTTTGTTLADFCRPIFGYRLRGWLFPVVCVPNGDAGPLVLVARLDLGRNDQHAESGSVLLGGHHTVADIGNGARRLDDTGLGYVGGALAFAVGLAVLALAYYVTNVSRVLLFWAAFILSRPLGATVGDFLDKPVSEGGLALSRPIASAVIGAFIIACLIILPQRAGPHPGRSEMTP